MHIGSDESAVREVHSSWIDAVNAGDLPRLLTLMTDDVVFLNPGRELFGRREFPNGFLIGHQRSWIHCVSEIEEVAVFGEDAYTRCRDLWSVKPRVSRSSIGVGRPSDYYLPQTARRALAPCP